MHIDTSQALPLFELASQRLGGFYRPERGHKVMTLIGAKAVVAQAIFSNFRPGVKFELSMWSDASRGLGGRRFIQAVFTVGFEQWGCLAAYAFARAGNSKSLRALSALGFRREASLPHWFGDEAGECFCMLRKDCKWL